MNESCRHHTIASLAEDSGFSVHTLRYYERIGLLAPIARNQAGHRVYDAFAVEWVTLLGHLRSTGMPIRTMQQFAELVRAGSSTVPERITLLETHRQTILQSMQTLQDAQERVDEKLGTYRAGGAVTPQNGDRQ